MSAMKIDLTQPIDQLVSDVKAGRLTATDLTKASLQKIKDSKSFNAVIEVNSRALEVAERIDELIKNGEDPGRLAGIPFICKDNLLTLGTDTTAASNILKGFKAPYQSTAVSRLIDEGAVLVAKSNLDAFAHGSSTENSDFGPTKNPHDAERVPGGSSGGSAAAVALGLSSFALGTDTGGSIRQPAALCGIVGLKPTYGLVSRYGVIAMGSSVDVVGPLTRKTDDAALVLEIISGQDFADSTTIERDPHSYADLSDGIKGKRFGLVKEFLGEGVETEVKQTILDAAKTIRKQGGIVEDISLPSVDLALACYYILIPAEISSNLARYDGIRFGHTAKEAKTLREQFCLSRSQGFGDEAKRRIILGTYVLSSGYYDAYYNKAQKVRTLLIKEFQDAFDRFDFLIGPTAPTTAFKLGQKNHDPLEMYLSDINTVAVNLIGVPAISIPAKTEGLPIGIQLIAPQRAERSLLSAAKGIEEAL